MERSGGENITRKRITAAIIDHNGCISKIGKKNIKKKHGRLELVGKVFDVNQTKRLWIYILYDRKKATKKKGKSGEKYEEEQSDFLECCLCAMQTHLLRFRMGKNNSHQNG